MNSFFRTPEKKSRQILILGDLLLIALSLLAILLMKIASEGELLGVFEPIARLPGMLAVMNWSFFFIGIAVVLGGLSLVVFYVAGLYELEVIFFKKRTVIKLGAALLTSQGLAFLLSEMFIENTFRLSVWFANLGVLFPTLLLWRYLFFKRFVTREPFKVLVFGKNGCDTLSRKAIDYLCSNGGRKLFRFSYSDTERCLRSEGSPSSNGCYDLIVYPFGDALPQNLMTSLVRKKFEGVSVCNSLTFYKNSTGSFPVFDLDARWLINQSISLSLTKKFQQRIKRVLDICAALLLGSLCSPLLLVISAAIKLTSRGPVLYKQERVGMGNREFTTHKFRTMVADAESRSGPIWARKRDPRMTAMGRILRRTGMDELPQLYDILRGNMSFVGPRPIRKVFENEFAERIPFYFLRHMVKPGLTGWGQVGNFDARAADGPQKRFEHDLFYIHEYSLFMDALIILKTFRKLIWARGE